MEKHPICYIVAGPNGAGKTTYALRYLPAIAACKKFINADEIAKGLSPLDFSAGFLQASRIFLDQLEQKIANRETFAFETTLSGRSYLSKIRHWRSNGWRVVLIYLYIPSPNFSAIRVQHRVKQGGHDIPRADIFRRYPRSIKNLFEYMEICDETFCVDNSTSAIVPVFEKKYGQPVSINNRKTYSVLQEVWLHE